MNFCPKCGNPLSSTSANFCPECGCQLTSNQSQDIEMICPECNTVITNTSEACPNCACPPEFFIQQEKQKSNPATPLECPECGKVFTETIPLACPECACPSAYFTPHKEEVPSSTPEQPNKITYMPVLIVLGFFLFMGGGIFSVYKIKKQKEERAMQEYYAYEQQAREQREAEQRRETERAEREFKQNQDKLKRKVIGTWYSEAYLSGNSIVQLRITFHSSGKLELATYHPQVGCKMGSTEYGKWEIIPHNPNRNYEPDYLVVKFNSGKGDMIEFNGGSFTLGNITFNSYNPY